jgi:hypothetical protein
MKIVVMAQRRLGTMHQLLQQPTNQRRGGGGGLTCRMGIYGCWCGRESEAGTDAAGGVRGRLRSPSDHKVPLEVKP